MPRFRRLVSFHRTLSTPCPDAERFDPSRSGIVRYGIRLLGWATTLVLTTGLVVMSLTLETLSPPRDKLLVGIVWLIGLGNLNALGVLWVWRRLRWIRAESNREI